MEIPYNRGGIVGDKISLQCKANVNAFNQHNTIIRSHYTHTNICARHCAIIHYNKVEVLLFILWFFGMCFFILGT